MPKRNITKVNLWWDMKEGKVPFSTSIFTGSPLNNHQFRRLTWVEIDAAIDKFYEDNKQIEEAT